MRAQYVGRHESRPATTTDREAIRRRITERIQHTYRGRHEITALEP